jgi:hypothetical protein
MAMGFRTDVPSLYYILTTRTFDLHAHFDRGPRRLEGACDNNKYQEIYRNFSFSPVAIEFG